MRLEPKADGDVETFMKNKWKRNVYILLLLLLAVQLPLPAKADTGPKPSVVLEIDGPEELYYVAMLSQTQSTGPASAYDEGEMKHYCVLDEAGAPTEAGMMAWEKFQAYAEQDGYYFLQQYAECFGTQEYKWGYYPPQTFKIVIYFPASDSFAVSPVCERYAFDSYFAVDVAREPDGSCSVTVKKSYDYISEILGVGFRILLTIGIEVLIALVFAYRKRKQLLVILAANLVTQTLLNLLLNYLEIRTQAIFMVMSYIFFEFIVFGLEAICYRMFLSKEHTRTRAGGRAVLYAFIANVVSLLLGIFVANVLPEFF